MPAQGTYGQRGGQMCSCRIWADLCPYGHSSTLLRLRYSFPPALSSPPCQCRRTDGGLPTVYCTFVFITFGAKLSGTDTGTARPAQWP